MPTTNADGVVSAADMIRTAATALYDAAALLDAAAWAQAGGLDRLPQQQEAADE